MERNSTSMETTHKETSELRIVNTAKSDISKTMSCADAGHLGGTKTLLCLGREHFVRAGKKGQEVFKRKYTTEDRVRWGRLGGRPQRVRYVEE